MTFSTGARLGRARFFAPLGGAVPEKSLERGFAARTRAGSIGSNGRRGPSRRSTGAAPAGGPHWPYAVSPDGRYLVNSTLERQDSEPAVIDLAWSPARDRLSSDAAPSGGDDARPLSLVYGVAGKHGSHVDDPQSLRKHFGKHVPEVRRHRQVPVFVEV
jgi:hypothetical protein